MAIQITPIYAGILALLLVYLSARVIQARVKGRVSVGDGGDKGVIKAMRVQANCAEYAPLGIVLLALFELQGQPAMAVHGLGLMLVVGRIMHAMGFGRSPQIVWMRRAGMIATLSMLIVTGIWMVISALGTAVTS